jgi:DUF917 family protein
MTQAKSELMVEKAFRAALSQMGSHVACAKGPITGKNTKSWVVEHTISLSWRIGRAVALSRSLNQIDSVAESIISEVGGSDSARILFKGKIVGVERTLRMGHVYGEVIIQSMDLTGTANDSSEKGRLKIPFKNENILAIKEEEDGSETARALNLIGLLNITDLPSDHRLGTRPHLCHRCSKRRGYRQPRIPIWPTCHRSRDCRFREMDIDAKRSGNWWTERFWDG